MSFSAPPEERYFEDYVPGAVHEFGPIEVDRAELLDFARRYDPQSFHTDPDAAARSEYGGLIASGWHTAGMMMRLYADHYLSSASNLVSPGVDEVRWTRPVRPGDQLRIRVAVREARRSRSKPDRGIVRSDIEMLNQHDEVVMSLSALNFFLTRDPD